MRLFATLKLSRPFWDLGIYGSERNAGERKQQEHQSQKEKAPATPEQSKAAIFIYIKRRRTESGGQGRAENAQARRA